MPLGFHLGRPGDSDLQLQLGNTLARHMAAADLLGRLQILRHAHTKTGKTLPLSTSSRSVRFDEQYPDRAAAGFAFDVGGDDAAERIRNLTPVTRQVFDGLTSLYKRDAFTLAGASDVRLIEKARDALAEAAQKGDTLQDWHAAVNKLTSDAGVEDLNAFSLDTAFQTAMQKVYSSGRLEQMQDPATMDLLPFWQYWTVGDLRVRPEHRVLDGFLARAIDPVWRRIYPPSGFNCRCSVVPMPENEALKLDENAGDDGLMRLPALAQLLVPQQGFTSLMHAR
jgi:SPP1 gp7 family putative phage head morphogenesis protein